MTVTSKSESNFHYSSSSKKFGIKYGKNFLYIPCKTYIVEKKSVDSIFVHDFSNIIKFNIKVFAY